MAAPTARSTPRPWAARRARGFVAQIEAARAGEGDAGPFGPFEAALADLVAAASTNTVTDERLDAVRRHAGEARVSEEGVEANLAGAAMIASAFGFLNVFNDLTGVKVEAEWASASEAGAGHGRRPPRGEPRTAPRPTSTSTCPRAARRFEEMIADHAAVVVRAGGPEAYAERELGLAPVMAPRLARAAARQPRILLRRGDGRSAALVRAGRAQAPHGARVAHRQGPRRPGRRRGPDGAPRGRGH